MTRKGEVPVASYCRQSALPLLCIVTLVFLRNFPLSAQVVARITLDANRKAEPIPALLWGTNVVANRNDAAGTVLLPSFVDSSRWIAPSVLRWPGGNVSDHYNWKTGQLIKPGRRLSMEGLIQLPEVIAFSRKIGAELSITINFGTMNAEDAADMVEFCNGPGDSRWGHVRDSLLAAMGFTPGPLNVRYFEIGNEILQKHMYDNSWTAESPRRYFLGGEAERRGGYPVPFEGGTVMLPKGDLIRVTPGDAPAPVYRLRFPPVKKVELFFIPDSAALVDCALSGNCTFERFRQVADLSTAAPGEKVFTLDSTSGTLRLGDGAHGFAPPPGSYLLAEYTTFGHDGFVEFARRMRTVESSVPIRIGAVMLPQHPGVAPEEWVPAESLRAVFEQMDFLILHHYLPTNSPRYASYAARRQVALERVEEDEQFFTRFRSAAETALGRQKPLGLAITEWNLFNKTDSLVEHNRRLEGALLGAAWFIETINRLDRVPVWIADQFNLSGWGDRFALIETDHRPQRIVPLGHVMRQFRRWRGGTRLPIEVQSPLEPAADRDVPVLSAAAAVNDSSHSLEMVILNNSEFTAVACSLQIRNFEYATVLRWSLSGARPGTGFGDLDDPIRLRCEESGGARLDTLHVPPLSITFLELQPAASTAVQHIVTLPQRPQLFPVYPNPLRKSFRLRFSLPQPGRAEIEIFDLLGRRKTLLFRGFVPQGQHVYEFLNPGLPAGKYFLRLRTAKGISIQKLTLVK